ncbi:MAG: hypothetical protein D6766_08395, partial [Verrucomicrobia bacterium]
MLWLAGCGWGWPDMTGRAAESGGAEPLLPPLEGLASTNNVADLSEEELEAMAALLGEEWPGENAPSPWNASIELRGGPGYKDNVLLSPHAPEGSAFWQTALDLFVFRLPGAGDGREATFFLSAEDVRYFSATETDQEQLIFGRAGLATSAGRGKASLGLDYVYMDQVFDASATELELRAVRARGHTLTWTPGWEWEAGRSWSVELELPAGRQWYLGELDSYWEAGPRLTLARHWSRGEAGLEYTPQWR